MEPIVQITACPVEYIERVWPTAEPVLLKATELSNSDISLVKENLLNSKAVLWVFAVDSQFVGYGVTEIKSRQNYSNLYVSFVAGDNMDFWLTPFIEELERYAKYFNLKQIEFAGRMGWMKTLKEFGFKPVYIAMTKDV